jgi:MFS family permease
VLEKACEARTMMTRLRDTRNDYPGQFWTLFFGTLINSAGSNLVFPFFSLYFTRQLGYSMTQMGVIFTLYAVSSMVSQLVGGELVDRVGRKPIMVASLFFGALSTLGLGLVGALGAGNSMLYVTIITVFAGVTGAIFGPAVNAMVADLVTPAKRTQAYGLLRIVQNLGVSIGPAIGGFIATRSYLLLFVIAALSAGIYSLIILVFTRETRPVLVSHLHAQTGDKRPIGVAGLGQVLADRTFMLFCLIYVVALLVWAQAGTTLPVYLNKEFGISEQWYGMLMSLNALMVVLLQFPLTRFAQRFLRANMMALGTALFAVGFGLYAVVSVLPLFFVAQAIWTLGEMISTPVSQAFVADAAPATSRGRYMGVYGLVFTLAFGIGPLFGGMIMDAYGGRYVWGMAVLLCSLAAVGFLWLGRHMQRPAATPASAEAPGMVVE